MKNKFVSILSLGSTAAFLSLSACSSSKNLQEEQVKPEVEEKQEVKVKLEKDIR